jgi:hypothetical protein
VRHSLIGGSVAKRILECPGSLKLYREVNPPDDDGSEYAREGSMLHAVMEHGIAEPVEALLGTEPGGFGVVLTQEHLDSKVYPARAAFNEYVSTLDEAMFFEQEVEVTLKFVHPDAFGNADLVGRHGNVLTVLDWKFGDGVYVDVQDNEQGLFYAAAALETPSLHDLTKGVEYVDIVIVQPQRGREGVWDVHRVSVADVAAFAWEMRKAVDLAVLEQPPMKLGDHCRWCRVKLHCELQKRGLQTLAFRVTHGELSELLTQCDRAEDFISEIRKEAFTRLEAGQPVPGWKLVPKRATRKWIDSEVAIATLVRVGKLKRKDLIVTEPVSPSVAEKMLKKKGADPKLLDSLVSAISSGSTLAPASDPRTAMPNIAALGKLVEGR